MTKNIIFYSGVFWPKNPYFEINFIKYLKKKNPEWSIKLLLNHDDVRLTGINNKNTLIKFNLNKYRNYIDLIQLKNYEDLINITKNIDLFIGSNIVTDRRQIAIDKLFTFIKCKILIIDLFGYDIVKKNLFSSADYIFVKGEIYKDWLIKDKFNEDNIFVTGSPYFDYYRKNKFRNFELKSKDFIKKYNIEDKKPIICVTTTNLSSSRISMNGENLKELIKFHEKFKEKYNFLLISYPNDYLFYEINKKYQRSNIKQNKPDYEYIQSKIDSIKLIQCQDNINALYFSDKIFHLSVGALSSEILYYFNKISYTMHFEDKEFYLNKIGYSKHIRFPDDICNIQLKNIDDLDKNLSVNIKERKNKIKSFFYNDFSHEKVNNCIKKIIVL